MRTSERSELEQPFHRPSQIERSQAARRDRILQAARQLASDGGYAAVTMQAVADRAGVGRATVYRYYTSKDHLLAEVHLAQIRTMVEQLRADPPSTGTPAERLGEMFGRIIDVAADDRNLTEAGVALALSEDPLVASAHEWRRRLVRPYLDAALVAGPDPDDEGSERDGSTVDRDAVAEVLQAVLFQCLLGLARGRYTGAQAHHSMSRAAQLLLGA